MYGTAMMGLLGGGGGGNLFAATPYTGNGAARSIVTGQNLAAGGLVWLFNTEGSGTTPTKGVFDTERGAIKRLDIVEDSQEFNTTNSLTAFNGNGFGLGVDTFFNGNTTPYIALTWLKQAGYLDVITYGGTSPTSNVLTHDNGAAPAMIIFKSRSNPYQWWVYHKSLNGGVQPERYYIRLNDNQTPVLSADFMAFTAPTSTEITLGVSATINQSGQTFVAYSFAEKAGVSKFGEFSGTTTVNTGLSSLKAILTKSTTSVGNWYFFYEDGGTWYHFVLDDPFARQTGLISVSGGDFTLSGAAAATTTGIYAAWG